MIPNEANFDMALLLGTVFKYAAPGYAIAAERLFADRPDFSRDVAALGSGVAILSFIVAVLTHPEWAQAHFTPFIDDLRGEASVIIREMPVEGRLS